MKHTPGPWKAYGEKIIAKNYDHDAIVAEVSGFWFPREAPANARLIAAAPDLLEACKALVNRLYHNAQAFHELPEKLQNDLINQARAAIAKAEGRE